MKSNIRWNLIGNLVYAFGQWLQLVVLAQRGGPAAVGEYAFALVLTAPVMVFASLCLRFILASDARSAYNFREYLSLRGATTAAAVLAAVTIAWVTSAGRGGWAILLPVCVLRAADALSDIYYGLWQQHERMSVIAWGLMLNSAASVAFMAGALRLGGGVPGAAVGAALGSCAALVFVRLRTASDPDLRGLAAPGSKPVAWPRVLRLSREAAPLGVTLLLCSLEQNVPRFFIQHHAGAAGLGFFVAASELTMAGDLVIGAIGAAATPRLASLCAAADIRAFLKLTRELVLAAIGLGLAGVTLSAVAGQWFLVILYGPDFRSGSRMLVTLSAAAGMGFVASLLGYSLTSARVITVQPLLLTLNVAMLVASCSIIVPRWGGNGAAWALLGATAVHAIASWIALRYFIWKPARSRPLHEVAVAELEVPWTE